MALSWVALVAIAVSTLTPAPGQAARTAQTPPWCLVCGAFGTTDIIVNIVLFIPLGLGLALMGWRLRRVIAVAAVLTLAIEALQLSIIPGRDASLSDVLTNTTGAALGAVLTLAWSRLWQPDRRAVAALTIVSILGWLGITSVTQWALAVDLPDSIYWGLWAPDLAHFDPFLGTVSSASVNGIYVPQGPFPHSEKLRQALSEDTATVRVSAVTATPPQDLAPIFAIFDHHQREILLLGQEGRAVVFHMRQRATRLRLRPIAVGVPEAFAGTGEDSVRLSAGIRGDRLWVETVSLHGSSRWSLRGSPGLGGGLLLPWPVFVHRGLYWVGWIWLGLLALPMSLCAARYRRIDGRYALPLGGMATALAAGLVVVPVTLGSGGALPPEWSGALVGALVGWGIGSLPPSRALSGRPRPISPGAATE